MENIREQLRDIARERDMLLMKVHELENFFSSPEAARPKHGMSPPSELRAFQESSKIRRTPQRNKVTSSTAPEKVAKIDMPAIATNTIDVQPEETNLPDESCDEEGITVKHSEDTDSIVISDEQKTSKPDKAICIIDGVGPGFQDHVTFATEMYRVCKTATAINIRKLTKGGWMVIFKDLESLKSFMDPWVWTQKPFGGAAKAHPPSEKRVVSDKPHPLEKVVKAIRVPKEISDQAFKDFLVSDGWKVSNIKSLPPAANLARPPSVKNVLVTFESQDDADKALNSGLRFQCFYIRTEQFIVYPDPGITRCFKCQNFGHIAARCERVMVCSLCGVEGHGWQSPDCTVNKNKKNGITTKLTCVNCSGEHHTGSKSCQFYKNEKRRLYSEIAQKSEKVRTKASNIVKQDEPSSNSIDLIKFTESLLKGLTEISGSESAGAVILKRLQTDLGGLFNHVKLPIPK